MEKIDNLIQTIRNVTGTPQGDLVLHVPWFVGNEWNYVKECLDTGWVSSVGKFVDKFERDLEKFTGAQRAVAVVNGTAALQVALQAVGVTKDDEVLMPSLTFVATANACHYLGATPHFVEVSEENLGVDAQKLEKYLARICKIENGACYNRATGKRISALIVMHAFGHPVDLDGCIDVCKKFNLEMVEDATESLGSYYKGQHTGTFCKVGVLSFNGNKTITTGGGGAVLTQDAKLGQKIKHLTTTAKLAHPWAFNHDEVGYNFRLPNINAALGCAQLEVLPKFLENKRLLAEKYKNAFKGNPAVKFLAEPINCKSNYWLNTIVLDHDLAGLQNDVLSKCHGAGVKLRPIWNPMHTLPFHKDSPKMDLAVTERLAKTVLNLPSSPKLVS